MPTMARPYDRLLPAASALLVALLLALPAAAMTPAQQNALDRALLERASGRPEKARAALVRLARQGVPEAGHELAVMALGRETPGSTPAQARRWLEAAARRGFVPSELLLGRAWEGGAFGRRDIALANRWYERAAAHGDVDAQVAIGTAYYLGRGAAHDMALAARWYREAAKGGDVGAMYLIASMYEQGDGVERDLRLARYWYEAAARSGDPAAPGKVQEIDQRLAAPCA